MTHQFTATEQAIVDNIIDNSSDAWLDFTLQFIDKTGEILFLVDFDDTLVANDKYNLSVDYATVCAAANAYLGEKRYSSAEVMELSPEKQAIIYKNIKPLTEPQLSAFKEYLQTKEGKMFDSFAAYCGAMSGKPIINLFAGQFNKDGDAFLDGDYSINRFIAEKTGEKFTSRAEIDKVLVKGVEVPSINEFVPSKVTSMIPGWEQAIKLANDKGIHLAIATSSEYSRVFPLLISTGAGKYFGINDTYLNWFKTLTEMDKAGVSVESHNKHWNLFHNALIADKTVHLYSAAELESRHQIDARKPDGAITGFAIAQEAEKCGVKEFDTVSEIEDSSSMLVVKSLDKIAKYAQGLYKKIIGIGSLSTDAGVKSDYYPDTMATAKGAKLVSCGANMLIKRPERAIAFLLYTCGMDKASIKEKYSEFTKQYYAKKLVKERLI